MPLPRLSIRSLIVSISLGAAMAAVHAQEGALSQLYAARPPAGASFVRVVNPLPAKLLVKVAEGAAQRIGGDVPATSYAIVAGGKAFAIQVDGRPAGTLDVRPGSFSTLVLRRDGAQRYAFAAIDDTTDTQDALKAELRFYNLAQGCEQAQLLIAPAGTPVFRDVAAGASAARQVNPVQARLSARCGNAVGAAATAAQALPTLQAGDHLGLFLTGTAAQPVLAMQPSRTDSVRR